MGTTSLSLLLLHEEELKALQFAKFTSPVFSYTKLRLSPVIEVHHLLLLLPALFRKRVQKHTGLEISLL